ncbi:hypothetical protein AB1Y20_003779 [Prymnesium parvum]
MARVLAALRLFYVLAAAAALAPRRVLVTGSNKGIGRAIVRRIVEDFPDVHVLLGSRSPSQGEAAVQKILEEVPGANVRTLQIDVSDDKSVAAANATVRAMYDEPNPLYGIVNNAGVGFGRTIPDTLQVNTYGPKRVCESFIPLLDPKVGRVCNIASASGPNFVRGLSPEQQKLFTSPDTTWEELTAVLEKYSATTDYDGVAYGLSKASLNVLTMIQAAAHPNLQINSCSPGYILTDLTRGMGATNTPENSNCHVAPLFLLFGEPESPPGVAYYYGSDAVRSPLYKYRGPGDPPYLGD